MATPLMTPEEAADYLRLKPQTLAKWRCHGKGPQFVRLGGSLGGSISYRVEDLDAFIAASAVTPEAK